MPAAALFLRGGRETDPGALLLRLLVGLVPSFFCSSFGANEQGPTPPPTVIEMHTTADTVNFTISAGAGTVLARAWVM